MSTKTKTPETAEAIGEEIRTLDKEIQSMESELEEGERPLVWDEVDSSTVEEIAAQEHRLAKLPRLIRAAKVKRQERRIRLYQLEVEPLYAERNGNYHKLERAIERDRKAKEEREAALGAWNITLSAVQGLERRIKDAERELSELRGEA
jgi:hypothetical protein